MVQQLGFFNIVIDGFTLLLKNFEDFFLFYSLILNLLGIELHNLF
jgi:hypothetical protein